MGSTFTYYYKIVDGLAGHLHVPLPRRGHRAHPDGDGRQPLRPPEAERHLDDLRRQDLHQVRLQRRRRLDRVRRRVPDPARLARPELPRPAHRHPAAALRGDGRQVPAAERPRLSGHGQRRASITTDAGFGNLPSQPLNSKITATAGRRCCCASRTSPSRASTPSARRFRCTSSARTRSCCAGPTGTNLYYDTNSVTLGGGESVDVILDTAGVAPGTYLLYTTNLNYLSNDGEDFGGMMTEITITLATRRERQHVTQDIPQCVFRSRSWRSLGLCAASPASAAIPGVSRHVVHADGQGRPHHDAGRRQHLLLGLLDLGSTAAGRSIRGRR